MRVLTLLFTVALLATACGDANLDEVLAESGSEWDLSVDNSDVDDFNPLEELGIELDDLTFDPEPAAPGASIVDAPAGQTGDRLSPVPAGQIADLGDGWRVQILDVIEDGTSIVLDEAGFNEAPPAGSRYTLVRIAVGYYGVDEPVFTWDVELSALANDVELDSDCGVVPDERPFGRMFSGAAWQGNVCFVTSGSLDAITLFTEQTFTFNDDGRVFMELADPGDVTPIPMLTGPQPGAAATNDRLKPGPAGTAQSVGENWTISVANGRAATDEIMSANEFNSGPPPGHEYYLIDLEAQYNGPDSATIFDLDIVGVSDSNLELESWCGSFDGEIEFDREVFTGGSLAGTECFVVPENEADSIVVLINESFEFDAAIVAFAPVS